MLIKSEKKVMRTQKMSEANEQEALFMWAAYKSQYWPELLSMYHIPNGGHRDAAEAAHLKRLGVKAGVPDICLPVARQGLHGLYIELKAGKTKQQNYRKSGLRF